MKTELKNISANNDLDFYYQNQVSETIEYFKTGARKGFFEPLEFLNLFWEQKEFVHKNLADSDLVISHLKELPLTDEQKHVLLGFILKWWGGYPVRYISQWDNVIHNTESDEITVQKQGTFNLITNEFLSYQGNTPEKEFCKRKRNENELIFAMQNVFAISNQEWENGKFGKFEFDDENKWYKFIECHHINGGWKTLYSRFNPQDYPIIAKGFIAFFIKNFNGDEIKTETDYYEKYYNPSLTEYKRREGKKLGASKKNLDAEFYTLHVEEEKENVKQSAELYEYLTPKENNLIKGFTDGYFEHIEQFKSIYTVPKEILELEKIYGIKLREISLEKFSWETRNTYALNSNGEITDLNLRGNQISEIKGLEMLENLQTLYLAGNQISEIKGLETLGNLKNLYLSENQISEIKGLETLEKLQKLNLSDNQISEIKGLEMLENLQILWLFINKISEIKGLEKLRNLQGLYLSDNQISEIEGLERLENLQSLNLRNNQISKVKGLETLVNLQELNLCINQISEIKGLEMLENLQSLWLNDNQIYEIKGLESIIKKEKIERLWIDNNLFLKDTSLSLTKNENHRDALLKYFSDLKPKEILELEKIYGIKLTEVEEKDFSWKTKNSYVLDPNGEISYLTLRNNQIREIKGLETLVNLQGLSLSYNQISEIKGLETLVNLQSLWLYDNQINEIKGLETLVKLQSLWLHNNKINEIKGLKTLINLQTLWLSSNQISEIKGLETLGNLQTLWIDNNQLSEIKELEKIIKREKFNYLRIHNNPFLKDISLFLETIGNHRDALLKYFSDLKPKEIMELEKIYGIELKEVSEKEFSIKILNSYMLNTNGEITHLGLPDIGLKEIKGLEKFVNLQSLKLSYNKISEIKGLEKLVNLQELDLYKNELTEIK
jgi:Leucine-rich repeat (LRR) protein